jgi:hypothetical protein
MNAIQFFQWGLNSNEEVDLFQIKLIKKVANLPLPTDIQTYFYLKINNIDVPLNSSKNQTYLDTIFNSDNNDNYKEIKIWFDSKYELPKIIESIEFYCGSSYGILLGNYWENPVKIQSLFNYSLNDFLELVGFKHTFIIRLKNIAHLKLNPKDVFDNINSHDGVMWNLNVLTESSSTPKPNPEQPKKRATSLNVMSPLNEDIVGPDFIVRCFGKPTDDGTYSVEYDTRVLRSVINPNNVNFGEMHDFKWIDENINRTSLTFKLDGTDYKTIIYINRK